MEIDASQPIPSPTQAICVEDEVGPNQCSKTSVADSPPSKDYVTAMAASASNNSDPDGIQNYIDASRLSIDQGIIPGSVPQDLQESSDGMVVQLSDQSMHLSPTTQESRTIRENSVVNTAIVCATQDDITQSELSLDTAGSQIVSPSESPRPSQCLLLSAPPLPPQDSQSALVPVPGRMRKGKRSRADEDFNNMLIKSRPKDRA
ncbi:hypothetical protein PsorP6_004841 [Peronosclerospora sorghi]|uniref:Uncharacterized protein n=1 Tax=Peronosclerospora sorghi TaxID=230839 RepID=A0ACC0VMH1_9STRA|nr:hypothetical protein PsorP6_004841 [Peronosclerospora sorghi]